MALVVELVSPERVVLQAEASMVLARTVEGGDVAFMAGHAPFLGALQTHTVTIWFTDGTKDVAAVHGGFISVVDDQVRILSDMAELGSQVDVARAEHARQRAEESARTGQDTEAEAALRRAQARLTAAGTGAPG
jgi:F-type H+-transporting ATPase subunit epsilon